MRRKIAAVFLTITALTVAARMDAQPPPGIASIKRSEHASVAFTPDRLGRLHSGEAIRQEPDGVVTATNVSLRYLIWSAYGMQGYQVIGGPGWLDSDGYDATFTRDVTPAMIQALLSDKLHLKVHRETQLRPAFNLIVTGKVRLPEPGARTRAPATTSSAPVGSETLPPCDRVFFLSGPLNLLARLPIQDGTIQGQPVIAASFWGRIDEERATIKSLVSTLSDILGRTVLDKTENGGSLRHPHDFLASAMNWLDLKVQRRTLADIIVTSLSRVSLSPISGRF